MSPENAALRKSRWCRGCRCRGPILPLVALYLLLTIPGCNTFGVGAKQQVKELRVENERLLSEFRAQRNQRAKAEEALRKMESRLAESEKMVARYHSPSANRISQRSTFQPPLDPNLGLWGQSSATPYGSYSPTGQAAFQDQIDPNSGLRWQRRVAR